MKELREVTDLNFCYFLAQIQAKIHRCFCKFIFWEIIKQNRLLKREEVVIVFFREVRGMKLKIVSLTFLKTLRRSESSPKAAEPELSKDIDQNP